MLQNTALGQRQQGEFGFGVYRNGSKYFYTNFDGGGAGSTAWPILRDGEVVDAFNNGVLVAWAHTQPIGKNSGVFSGFYNAEAAYRNLVLGNRINGAGDAGQVHTFQADGFLLTLDNQIKALRLSTLEYENSRTLPGASPQGVPTPSEIGRAFKIGYLGEGPYLP